MSKFTNAEIRGAILRAADRIERERNSYRFANSEIPSDCGTPSCMWGWIGFELGIRAGWIDLAANAIGLGRWDLYDLAINKFSGFTTDKSIAAAALRAFADLHFPEVASLVPYSQCEWRERALSKLKNIAESVS